MLVKHQPVNRDTIDVSVVIVNYRTAPITVQCVESIVAKTAAELAYEVIVVDNASGDGVEAALRVAVPGVRVITNAANVGYGRANNIGVEAARGEFVFLLNSDTILLTDALSQLCSYMRANPHVGASCGNLLTRTRGPNHSFGRCETTILNIILYRMRLGAWLPAIYNDTGRPITVHSIIGADLFIQRELYQKLGGFDPSYFMYFEDTDLSYRIRCCGYELHNLPDVEIIHLQGASSASERSLSWEVRSLYCFFAKHRSLIYSRAYLLTDMAMICAKLAAFCITRNAVKVRQYRNGLAMATALLLKLPSSST